MYTKSQSCQRGLKLGQLQAAQAQLHKTIKKPQSYLAKKFEELYQQDQKLRNKRKNKIEQIQKQKQQKEVQGCTFKPQINNNPEYYINSNDPFLKRQEDWKRNIDKKIAEKRQIISKKQKDQFTFIPKIIDNPLANSSVKVKQTKSINSNASSSNKSYSAKPLFVEKKSYRVLHGQRKKFMQITKATIVEPFKHRRIHTAVDANQKLEETSEIIQQENHNTSNHEPEKILTPQSPNNKKSLKSQFAAIVNKQSHAVKELQPVQVEETQQNQENQHHDEEERKQQNQPEFEQGNNLPQQKQAQQDEDGQEII